jgi:hypothetical protein
VSLNHQNPLRGPRYSSGVLIERAYKQGGRGGESSKVSTRMIEARCQCREKGGERERERESGVSSCVGIERHARGRASASSFYRQGEAVSGICRTVKCTMVMYWRAVSRVGPSSLRILAPGMG